MAKTERVRETLSTPLTREYLEEKARDGWRAVAVEWERGSETGAAPDSLPMEEVPYGLRISEGGDYLVEDPAEVETLTLILDQIVEDKPLSAVAERLNQRGFRRRNGTRWTQVSVFNLLPRLIEVAPRIYATDEWSAKKRHVLKAIG